MGIEKDLSGLIKSVTKEWTTAKKHTDKVGRSKLERMRSKRHVTTIKSVFENVIEAAYRKASADGKYYANARQIYYAARPELIRQTDRPEIDSKYFTQTLLKNYLLDHDSDPEVMRWKVVWDARGHFKEPHTDTTIGVGGLEVLKYTSSAHGDVSYGDYEIHPLVQTQGNRNRFSSVLFIEKEGFNEILEDAGIDREFDMAIISTKGIPVDACINLLSFLTDDGCTVYALHDFDYSGFTIMKTLREGTKLTHGVDVVELGFRLEDIDGLPNEDVYYSSKRKKNPGTYLRKYGATQEEIEFLVDQGYFGPGWYGHRVELNAMTSDQLITWLRAKLRAHKAGKYIPEKSTVLKDAYKRAVLLQKINKAIEETEKDFNEDDIEIPDELRKKIKEHLKTNTRQPWDFAVWNIAEEIASVGK